MLKHARILPILALNALLLVSAGCADRSPVQGGPADVVLRGGAVYTMDASRSWAEAVAIRGNSIVYVGNEDGVSGFIGGDTRVVDLKGKMVLPGFQDSHIHPVSGGIAYVSCPLYDFETTKQYIEAIRECDAGDPGDTWIRGSGWSLAAFAPTGIPDKVLLDAVVPHRPVYFDSSDGHSAWVNSKALELAGITNKTPDPAGGRIDRDPSTGEALGGLQDSAMGLILKVIPPITEQMRQEGLRYALKMLNRFGVTSFQDAIVMLDPEDPEQSEYASLDAYRALDDRGELTARAVLSLWWDRNQGLEQIPALVRARKEHTRGNVRATTVKVMQDGVMEVQTAAVLEPYVGTDETGLVMIEPELLKRAVTGLDKEGFQVHFHAIGDAAIRHCLDAIEVAREANGARDSRHHISHIELFHPDDVPRFHELDVIANFQPLWAYADPYITELTIPFLRPEQVPMIYPIASLFKSGATVAFGSDWSVSSANPLEEIETAVTRRDAEGADDEPFVPDERISLHDALVAFTLNAAYVNFQDDLTGSIEEGKLADMIVLDRNLFEIDPSEISEAQVLLTLLDGRPVYGTLEAL